MFVRFCGVWQVHGPHGFRQRSIECLDFLMVDHENADLADMPPNGRASPKVRSILLLAGMYCRYRTHARTLTHMHPHVCMRALALAPTHTYRDGSYTHKGLCGAVWQALTNAPRIVGKHIQELPLPPPRQGTLRRG